MVLVSERLPWDLSELRPLGVASLLIEAFPCIQSGVLVRGQRFKVFECRC